jgi:uracil DNA glycosylase
MTKEQIVSKNKEFCSTTAAGNNWHLLASYFKTRRFGDVVGEIYDDKISLGKDSTPKLKDIVKPFQLLNKSKVMAVIIRSHPFTDGSATGLAFDTNGTVSGPSKKLLSYINQVSYDGKKSDLKLDVAKWTSQGILFLNASPTAYLNSTLCEDRWRDYYLAVLTELRSLSGIHYVFVGEGFNTEYKELVDEDSNTVSVVTKGGDWIDAIRNINDKYLAYHGEHFKW